MNECVLQAEKMMVVVLIKLAIELFMVLAIYLKLHRRECQTKSRTDTSIMLWLKYAVLFFTTLTATTS